MQPMHQKEISEWEENRETVAMKGRVKKEANR